MQDALDQVKALLQKHRIVESIANMDSQELVAAAEQLDTDELADLVQDLPQDVVAGVFQSLSVEEREQLRSAMSYPEDSVGALMTTTLPWAW